MKRVLVVYHSDTGNTKQMAELIAEGCGQVRHIEADVQPALGLDLDAAAKYDGYALGSPDYFSYPAGELKMFFDKILRVEAFHGKPFVGFGSHGGGARVLEVIERLAKGCKLERVTGGVMCMGAPDGTECPDMLHSLGKALAMAVMVAD